MPHSPFVASAPVVGSTTATPRSRSVARFACVAGCSHMWWFIAGATTTGHVAASAALVSRSSASPCASLAIVLAVAGAIEERRRRCARAPGGWRIVRRRRLVGERAARRVALELARQDRRAAERGERRRADEALRRLASARRAPRGRPWWPGARPRAPCRRRSRRRRRGGPRHARLPAPRVEPPLAPVVVVDLARGDFLEGDRQVVLRTGLHHRRRELVEGPLTEVVVVRVDLARALGGDENGA